MEIEEETPFKKKKKKKCIQADTEQKLRAGLQKNLTQLELSQIYITKYERFGARPNLNSLNERKRISSIQEV